METPRVFLFQENNLFDFISPSCRDPRYDSNQVGIISITFENLILKNKLTYPTKETWCTYDSVHTIVYMSLSHKLA